MYHFSYVLLWLLISQIVCFAQTPMPTPPPPLPENISAEPEISEANLIHPGDLIDVDVIGNLEYDWRGTLNPEGFLDGINFIENPIYGLCQSETEIAEAITKAYGKILREPKVVVKILDRSNRPLSIVNGAIKIPQRFQIKRPVFLNELLILSGGLTENASGEVQIFRPQNLNCQQKIADKTALLIGDNGENRERYVAASQDNGSSFLNIRLSDLLAGKKQSNPQILSGDIITVQETDLIYVIGGVANPKQIASRAQTTLTRAISSAGGVTKNADVKKITIYRREGLETKTIEADLEAINNGKNEDLVLKPFDVVEVGQNGRTRSKFAPVVKTIDNSEKNTVNFPLRIID